VSETWAEDEVVDDLDRDEIDDSREVPKEYDDDDDDDRDAVPSYHASCNEDVKDANVDAVSRR